MKYYIIAGEPSGDLHGSNLMKSILVRDPNAEFRYWGGDHMASIADGMITHIKETSIMGFTEVLKNIGKIRDFFKKAKATIQEFQPDKIIYIDYPGFNLRMAEWSKKEGFYNVFYISPQLWAWKKGRVKKVKRYIDDMICILPFEKDFYSKYDVDAHYVGHPLLPMIQSFVADPNFLDKYKLGDKKVLAILPGSREQEIIKMLPEYLSAASQFRDEYHIVLAAAPNVNRSFYSDLIGNHRNTITIIDNDTYNLLSVADLALVTSGTATLETALFRVPQVVCYKTSSINYAIGKRLVDLNYICLVNLILDQGLVTELIQNEAQSNQIVKALQDTLNRKHEISLGYETLIRTLSKNRISASDEVARIVTTFV
ncbi:MAG: lipid-A-disaccharide synthase [Saprospiraceae bacterium]|jgi:lipid-A-disaccharide synthase